MSTASNTSDGQRGNPPGQGDEVLRKLLQTNDGTEYTAGPTPVANVNPVSSTAAKAETAISSPAHSSSSTNNPLLKVNSHATDVFSFSCEIWFLGWSYQ